MSDATWTPDQQRAIEARGSNILVAAAAGSGKTATLVERIIRRLTDPVAPIDVDQLLVVTFTEAAATEMRERIAAALTKQLLQNPEDSRLQRQLTLLSRAAISTLHSFCLGLIRQYFYRLGIDPAVSVLGEQEALLLRQEVLDDLFARRYEEEPDGPFYQLLERYGGGRDDSGLRELVLTIYDFTQSLIWPDGWLAEAVGRFHLAAEAPIEQLPWWLPLRRQVELELNGAVASLTEAVRLAMLPAGPAAYVETLLKELAAVRAAAAGAPTWEGLAAAVQAIRFDRAPAVKAGTCDEALKEQVADLRSSAKKVVTTLRDTYFSRPAAEWLADLRAVAPHMQALAELVQQFGAAFRAAKAEQSAIDFNDLERFALQLLADQDAGPGTLRPTDVARELRTRFAEILVDEYQDINAVQDAILTMVAQDGEEAPANRFMVGDVKQSIYRFRHANPTLFLDKYRAYSPDGEASAGGRRIVLGANFRSRQGVVDAVNFLFRQIMTASVAEIDYDRDAELVCRAGYPEVEGWREPPVELHLLDRTPPEAGEGEEAAEPSPEQQELADLSSLEKEARLVARRIKELVESRIPVFDKAAGGYRPVRYRDIVVLLRATTGRANIFVEALAAAGIPAYAQLATGYFAATEIEVMLAFLAVLDNPRQDIPLAAVLRSPIVGLSAADLARVRLASKGSLMDAVYAASRLYDETGLADVLRQFTERLNAWRTAVRRRPLSEVLWQVYEETGYLTYVQGMPGGAQRHANLLALYDRARQFDQFARQGLFRFLRFIEGLKAEEADMGAAPAIGEAEDVVRIMSIHKSKGLEFPVTIVADLGKALNRLDLTGDLLLQRDYGFGPNLIDPELRAGYPTLAWHAVRQAIRMEALAEEMRILYVALTRARERLILVGSVKDLPKCCKAWAMSAGAAGWALPDPVLAGARSYLDWICPSLVRHVGGSPLLVAAGQATTAAGSSAPEVARDPSRWDVRIWDAEAQLLLASAPPKPADEAPLDWEAIGAMRPIDHTPAADAIATLKARFAWEYEYTPVVQRFGKLTVTELKGHFNPDAAEPAVPLPGALPPAGAVAGEPEEAPEAEPLEPARPRVSLTTRPRFLQQGKSALTPTELGTLMHLVLQHLDLRRPLDHKDVAAQVAALAEQEILAPAHAAAVDLEAIARFFASPLGQRIKARPDRVQREVSFTLALPAAEVYPDLDPRLTAGESVIVQGMIDLLLELEDGFLLLDYKTDKREPEEGARQYRTQVSLYRRAVEEILGKPVKEAYLHFLASGNSVPV